MPASDSATNGGVADDDLEYGRQPGWRAERTRQAILAAAQQLFLDRGYGGTRINDITEACGVSRASFYTYFRDKRDVFNGLGQDTYHDLLDVVGEWADIPSPCNRSDVVRWVQSYFSFMDRHGALTVSAQSGPADEAVRLASNKMQLRVARLLGAVLASRKKTSTGNPAALGLAATAMLDRSWYHCHHRQLAIGDEEIVGAIADYIMAILER
ncbi:AcrR family transcriptional regulator [Mycobacterium sp. OAS707]|uniref:TetR/AcrR family transcriptional regulator n=1 Tax=Mycobacterium sp. OAS707 TaxID=2663822 RepID=UPI00178980AA|nr:TetR/AcrR family transcriptional regulator [Mycobacterium sp. OAS707]MBE1552063.1 AcrR family transcriptional regulator [Mycobacterium sp. OAS707]